MKEGKTCTYFLALLNLTFTFNINSKVVYKQRVGEKVNTVLTSLPLNLTFFDINSAVF